MQAEMVGVILGSAAIVGSVVFACCLMNHKRHDRSISPSLFLKLLAIGMVSFATIAIAVGAIGPNLGPAAIAVMSAVAGYTLGGVRADSRQQDSKADGEDVH